MRSGQSAIPRWSPGVAIAACVVCNVALAGNPAAPPNYGHDFVTVGAPGNRPALASERVYGATVTGFPNLGHVNYEYRISRTEMTTGQWLDFVSVAWPFAEALGYTTRQPGVFTGQHITANNLNPSLPPNYSIVAGTADIATDMSFRFAAWYCNWSHNGQPTTNLTMDTFTTGAYDAATLTRQQGALYWIPSLDEWTKATYYDPNRNGLGLEGYWRHPGRSDTPLVGGPPGAPGAQTSAGGWWSPGMGLPPDVGAYPGIQSPWGLLDTSGGLTEMTDSLDQFGQPNRRIVRGRNLSNTESWDEIDFLLTTAGLDTTQRGFRIASAVPCPGVLTLIPLGFGTLCRRERRHTPA